MAKFKGREREYHREWARAHRAAMTPAEKEALSIRRKKAWAERTTEQIETASVRLCARREDPVTGPIIRARDKIYGARCYAAHREQRSIAAKKRYADNPEPYALAARRRRAADPDKVRAQKRDSDRRCSADPIVMERRRRLRRVSSAARRSADRERYNREAREYRAAHPLTSEGRNRAAASSRKWHISNPLNARIRKSRRRARELGNGGSHTVAQWRMLCEAWEWSCSYCGVPVTERGVERDHKIPLSRGGSDDISNIAVSCRRCNRSKGTQTVEEFLRKLVA